MSIVIEQPTSPSMLQSSASASASFIPDHDVCSRCNEFAPEDYLMCKKCGETLHYNCTDLPPYEILKYIKEKLYHRKYSCDKCMSESHKAEMENLKMKMKMKKIDGHELLINDYKRRLEIRESENDELQTMTARILQKKEELETDIEKMRQETTIIQRKNEDLLLTLEVLNEKLTNYEEEERKEKHNQPNATLSYDDIMKLVNQHRERTNSELTVLKHMIENIKGELHPRMHEEQMVRENQPQRQFGHPRPRPWNGQYRRRTPTCYTCGRRGHITRTCYHNQRKTYGPRNYRQPQPQWYNPTPITNYPNFNQHQSPQLPYPPMKQQYPSSNFFGHNSVQPFI